MARDGYAAAGLVWPELDGTRLALLGLHNAGGASYRHALLTPRPVMIPCEPFETGASFPFRVKDSGERWHQATAARVLVTGQGGQARAELPLRWAGPS